MIIPVSTRSLFVPIVSQFFGITIPMFHRDHPPAHFHAEYGEHELIVELSPIAVNQGKVPNRAARWCWNGLPYTIKNYSIIGSVAGPIKPRCPSNLWTDEEEYVSNNPTNHPFT
jgi:hypothetical protein